MGKNEKKEKEEKEGKMEKVEKGKIDKEFLLYLSIFIISVGVLIGIFIFFRTGKTEVEPTGITVGGVQETKETKEIETEERKKIEKTKGNVEECLASFGITKDTIIFIYSDKCPYSNQMKPIVENLSGKYKFYWADAESANTIKLVSSCLYEIASFTGTPEFVCPANGKNLMGAVSGSELETFSSNCK